MTSRAAELRDSLTAVRDRVAAAARAADRHPDEVTLVVVTKFFPAADVLLLRDLGVRHVGENRLQEAIAKREEAGDPEELTWHFVGSLQSNKARAAGAWADVVHSVDRRKLVAPLSRGAQESATAPPLDVLLQVDLDDRPPGEVPGAGGRGGADPEHLLELADAVAAAGRLRLRGLMAVAPYGVDPRPPFARLAQLSRDLQERHPGATWLSAGMSGDLESAVAAGATHVRVGAAVLGKRPDRR